MTGYSCFTPTGNTNDLIELATGEPAVAKPPRVSQCWALVEDAGGRFRRCRSNARGVGGPAAKLTCFAHRGLEEKAQALCGGVK